MTEETIAFGHEKQIMAMHPTLQGTMKRIGALTKAGKHTTLKKAPHKVPFLMFVSNTSLTINL